MLYRGINVLTFKDIDGIHGLPNGTAKNKFKGHKEWFVPGEDYIPIPRYTYLQEVNPNGSRAGNLNSNILLITESGYDKLKSYLGDFQEPSPQPAAQPQDLQVFNYLNNEVRIIMRDAEPWWVLKDVCGILEIKNNRDAANRLDNDEKDDVGINDAIGRKQNTTIINEFGLYNVILLSRKKEAKQFKRWVTHEVLPTIRKTGSYSVTSAPVEACPEKDELTKEDWLRLGELISNTPKDRLPYLLIILNKVAPGLFDVLQSGNNKMAFSEDFASILKRALKANNMAQSELAEKIRCGKSSISQYCSGTCKPSAERVLQIANALHLSVSELC